MWPDITPLLQQLKKECSDKAWLITGKNLNCPLAELDLTHTTVNYMSSEQLLTAPFTQRFAAALMLLDEQDDFSQGTQVISKLRDLLAERVLVITSDQSTTWSTNIMLGFGFKRIAELKGYQAWGFDIHTYKEVPDWLNAKFWANPQNWGKYWW